jgi:hypothetical protein
MVRIFRIAFHAFIVLHFGLVIPSLSARPDACLCGQACGHGLYDGLGAKRNTPYHKRCHQSVCKSCNIEKGTSLDRQKLHNTDNAEKSSDAQNIIVICTDAPLKNETLKHLYPIYYGLTGGPLPIYLQNRALLL